MYEGRTARGRVTHTLSRGRLAWADGEVVCEPGTGRFVPTPPFAPTLFGGMAERDAAAAQARIPVRRDDVAEPATEEAAEARHESRRSEHDEL